MRTSRWMLTVLSVVIAGGFMLALVSTLGGEAHAQAMPPVPANGQSADTQADTSSSGSCGGVADAAASTRARSSYQLQSSTVPTYYIDDNAYEVKITQVDDGGDPWEKGCFEAFAEADVVAVVFSTTVTGNCTQLKRMGSDGSCSGLNLWGPTSGNQINDGFYCFSKSGSVACEVVAPDAISRTTFITRPGGSNVRGGFQFGDPASCEGVATVYGIRLVYYGIPPELQADQSNAPCDCPVGCAEQNQDWVGGPINTRTGNYHYSQRDISIAALGGPLYFERSYNSLETDLYTDTLSPGWTHNYDMDLTFYGEPGGEEDTVIVKGCRGSRFRFADNDDGTFDPYPGVWATMTRTQSMPYTYTLTGVDNSVYSIYGL
jgi:hypothetical protein